MGNERPIEQIASQPEEERARVEALLPAYAIGACDADDAAFVDDGLTRYPELAHDLEQFQGMTHALLTLMPTAEPPKALSTKLHAAVRSEAARDDGTAAHQAMPTPRVPRRGWLAAAGWRWALGASLLALLLLNSYWLWQNRALQTEQVQLIAQISDQRAAIGLLSDDEVYRTEIFDPEGVGDAKASVIWNEAFPIAILYAEGFPQLEADQTYQIWLIQGEERISGGLFDVDRLGTGTVIMHLPATLDSFSAMGITPEPRGGSSAPTAPPVVRGPI